MPVVFTYRQKALLPLPPPFAIPKIPTVALDGPRGATGICTVSAAMQRAKVTTGPNITSGCQELLTNSKEAKKSLTEHVKSLTETPF